MKLFSIDRKFDFKTMIIGMKHEEKTLKSEKLVTTKYAYASFQLFSNRRYHSMLEGKTVPMMNEERSMKISAEHSKNLR